MKRGNGAKISLVKITADEDGCPVNEPVWCLSEQYGDAMRTLCSGEVYGEGEGTAEAILKQGFGKDITCRKCRHIIKKHQEIIL